MRNKNEIIADTLSAQREEIIKQQALLDIDIAVLEQSNPDLVIQKKKKEDGSVIEITVRDLLNSYTQDRQSKDLRLEKIDQLLGNNSKDHATKRSKADSNEQEAKESKK